MIRQSHRVLSSTITRRAHRLGRARDTDRGSRGRRSRRWRTGDHNVRKAPPDLVLMDLRMPGKSARGDRAHPAALRPARVLILSAFDGDEEIHGALAAGAQGYVLKSSTGDELIPAIRAVAAGKRWIPHDVATRLKRATSSSNSPPRVNVCAKSPRSRQQGIADVLGITEHTIKDHLKSILAKLRASESHASRHPRRPAGIIRSDSRRAALGRYRPPRAAGGGSVPPKRDAANLARLTCEDSFEA